MTTTYEFKGLPASQRPATKRQRRSIAMHYGTYPTDWISVEEASILISAKTARNVQLTATQIAARLAL